MRAIIEAAAAVIDATDEELLVLDRAATPVAVVGSPLWYALPPSAMPDPAQPLDQLVAWCGTAIGVVRDAGALGAVIGLVHEIYTRHGWAIAAAHAAIGDFPELDRQIAARARDRLVTSTADLVADAEPDQAALEAVGAEPPAGDTVRGGLAQLIELAGRAEPEDHAVLLDEAASLFGVELALQPSEPRDTTEVMIALHELGRHEWTWDDAFAWRDEDPVMLAKAIARGSGHARLTAAISDVQGRLADLTSAAIEAEWRAQVERVRAASAIVSETPLVEAILDLADDAAAQVAARIARAALAVWEGGRGERIGDICAEAFGDPRDLPALWEPHVERLRGALR